MSDIGKKCHLSPVSPLKLLFKMRIICGVFCERVSSQKYNMTFNCSSGTSYPLNPSQYYMITNTARSLISILWSSDLIINQYYPKYSNTSCIASPDKQKLFILITSFILLFTLMKLSNHVPLVGVVVTTIFMSSLSKVVDPSLRTSALQILPYAAQYLLVLYHCK